MTFLQVDFLRLFTETALKETFFLTGGTALSAFHLHHRVSEGMGFFTEEEGQIPAVLPLIQDMSAKLDGHLEVKRSFRSHLEFIVRKSGETLRCDFAMDSPYRLKERVFNEEYGIYVDTVHDISCNKLSALYDRSEPKDFVDIYFIDGEILPFEKLVQEAKKKHIGPDNYWLAISLAKIEDFGILPRMLKPVTPDELRTFFKEKARWLMRGIG